jgi:hypothetical protein
MRSGFVIFHLLLVIMIKLPYIIFCQLLKGERNEEIIGSNSCGGAVRRRNRGDGAGGKN